MTNFFEKNLNSHKVETPYSYSRSSNRLKTKFSSLNIAKSPKKLRFTIENIDNSPNGSLNESPQNNGIFLIKKKKTDNHIFYTETDIKNEIVKIKVFIFKNL